MSVSHLCFLEEFFVVLVGVCVLIFLIFVFVIFQLFKHPLEKEGQVGGPILAQEEIKTIFGSIPEIYEVHIRIKVMFSPLCQLFKFTEKCFQRCVAVIFVCSSE